MQFELQPGRKDEKLCSVSHHSETLNWTVGLVVKTSSLTSGVDEDLEPIPMDLFKYTNQWLESLSIGQQDQLFAIYVKAKDCLLYMDDHDQMVIDLREYVRAILDFQEFRVVHRFLRMRTDIQDPLSVMDVFEEDSAGRNKKNKTYVKSEYQELVTLSFLFRLLLPIWGEYLLRVSAYVGAADKELSAYELVSRSMLVKTPAMERLKSFVENTIPTDTNKSPALIDGISTDDYSRWMLSLVVLRKLIVGNLQDSGEAQGPTLVSFIYNYIRSRAKNDPNYGGFIKDKQHPNSNATDDVNALSHWEEYRVKEPTSAGDIALVRQDLMDSTDLYWKLCIGLDEAESARFEPSGEDNKEFKELMSEPIGIAQITMLQYVLSPIVSHRLLYDLDRVPIYNGLRAAAAYLKRIDQLEAAIIMTAVKHTGVGMTSSTSSVKHHFTEEIRARLTAIFPYDRKTQSRQTVVDSKTSYDVAFDAFEDHLRRSEWRITLPQSDIVKFTGGTRVTRAYTCPNDIKVILAEFFIAMNDSAKRIRENRKLIMEKILNVQPQAI